MITRNGIAKVKKVVGIDNLYELRGLGKEDKNQRIIFMYVEDEVIIVWTYLKKSPKIPKPVLFNLKKIILTIIGEEDILSTLITYTLNEERVEELPENLQKIEDEAGEVEE